MSSERRTPNAIEILAAIGPVGHLSARGVDDLQAAANIFTSKIKDGQMPSLKELRERRGQLNKQFQDIVNRVESENRDVTHEEDAALKKIHEDDLALVNRIRIQEDAANRNEELNRIVEVTAQQRVVGINGIAELAGPNSQSGTATDLDCATSALILNGMGRSVDSGTLERAERAGFRSGMNALEIPLQLGRPTPGNQVSFSPRNAMHTQMPGKGGIWVPAGFMGRLESAMKQFGPMIETSQVWVTEDGRETIWPTMNDTSNEGVLIGQNDTAPETDMSAGGTRFDAFKGTSGLLKVPYEMLRDTPINLAGEIGYAFGIRLGRLVNRLCTVGDAPNSPRGIVKSAPIGKVTASSTVLTADEVIDLIASVDPAYRAMPGCGFMMHPDVFAAISKLKDSTGQYLSGTLEAGIQSKLRGYPVAFNPHMSSTFAAGETIMLFGDLQSYKLRIVGTIRLRQMTEKFADADQVGFVAFMEFDGPLLDAGTHPVKSMQLKP